MYKIVQVEHFAYCNKKALLSEMSTVNNVFLSSLMLLSPTCTSDTTHPNILHGAEKKHIVFLLKGIFCIYCMVTIIVSIVLISMMTCIVRPFC